MSQSFLALFEAPLPLKAIAIQCEGWLASGGTSHTELLRWMHDQGVDLQSSRVEGYILSNGTFVSRQQAARHFSEGDPLDVEGDNKALRTQKFELRKIG